VIADKEGAGRDGSWFMIFRVTIYVSAYLEVVVFSKVNLT
jgi:hypothetical protein